MSIDVSARLTFITPAFCAGPDPAQAEVRAPAIRGQLRWWFRVLGGTPDQEQQLFGGVHNGTHASKVTVRVRDLDPRVADGARELPKPNTPGYYLSHFARVSGNKERYNQGAWFDIYTAFTVDAFSRLSMSSDEERAFLEAWEAFLLLGSLGLRQTRGFGAFSPQELTTETQVISRLKALKAKRIRSWYLTQPNSKEVGTVGSWKVCQMLLEATLAHLRQHGFSSSKVTPLGNAKPRQASGLHLRPIFVQGGQWMPVLFYVSKVVDDRSLGCERELLKLLDGRPEVRYPYQQRAPKPENRDAISILAIQ
ncbi:MAG: type III-B CRISPR module RAMP protein Cmr1 [Oligosphaeraceae bacterium]